MADFCSSITKDFGYSVGVGGGGRGGGRGWEEIERGEGGCYVHFGMEWGVI